MYPIIGRVIPGSTFAPSAILEDMQFSKTASVSAFADVNSSHVKLISFKSKTTFYEKSSNVPPCMCHHFPSPYVLLKWPNERMNSTVSQDQSNDSTQQFSVWQAIFNSNYLTN